MKRERGILALGVLTLALILMVGFLAACETPAPAEPLLLSRVTKLDVVKADGTKVLRIDNNGNLDASGYVSSTSYITGATLAMANFRLTSSPVDGYVLTSDATGVGAWAAAAGGGTEYTEDAAAPANPEGGTVMMTRDDALSTVTEAEGDWSRLRGTAEGALWVQDFNSDAILADTADIEIAVEAISGTVSGSEMQVDIVADGAGLATDAKLDDIIADTDSISTAVNTIDDAISGNEMLIAGGATQANDVKVTLDGEVATITATTALPVDVSSMDITSIAAGETHIGEVSAKSAVVSVTLTLDTSQYANGDLLADTQALTDVMRVSGGTGVLYAATVIDLDDQAGALDIFVLDTNCSAGTENSAVSIADSCADDILGGFEIASGDYLDLGNSRIATVSPSFLVGSTAGIDELWFFVVSRDTITYTVNGIVLKFHFLLD